MSDKEVVSQIVDEIARLIGEMGFPQVTSKVWATLYFKNPMTQDKLKSELNCGLSSISQSIKLLEKWGVIYIKGKDGRKNIYAAELSFKKIKRKKMDAMLMFHIDPMIKLLSNKAEQISDKKTKEKVIELKNMYSKCGTILKLILKMPFGK